MMVVMAHPQNPTLGPKFPRSVYLTKHHLALADEFRDEGESLGQFFARLLDQLELDRGMSKLRAKAPQLRGDGTASDPWRMEP